MPVSLVQTRARNHYRRQQKVALAAVRAVRRVVKKAASPPAAVSAAATTMAAYQLASATSAGRTMAAEAGRQVLTAPIAFAGTTMLDRKSTRLDSRHKCAP